MILLLVLRDTDSLIRTDEPMTYVMSLPSPSQSAKYVQVAATLRRMREEAGLSRKQAAGVLGCTTSKIGDLETGRSGAKPVELAALLDRYGVTTDERDDLLEFARTSTSRRPRGSHWATIPGSHHRFLDLERQATSAIFYSGELIHGALQTEGYAQALLR